MDVPDRRTSQTTFEPRLLSDIQDKERHLCEDSENIPEKEILINNVIIKAINSDTVEVPGKEEVELISKGASGIQEATS